LKHQPATKEDENHEQKPDAEVTKGDLEETPFPKEPGSGRPAPPTGDAELINP
jgi:hypothetical protein